MLYKIIGTILMSDAVGLLLLMQLWLSKYEENELEESQKRLENTIKSMSNLTKEYKERWFLGGRRCR